ncbi:hypothetical protein OGZ39_09100 [Lactococcus lactis]|jgi:DNA repair photolyase|uniref:Radical SAM protein n=1 Tax=Lactococcus lactis TaxID=1358 RepID=A0A9X4S3Y1_9LACT|nr:hypothetical protein [Lactococcus lactis]MDG4981816.1 hypothetical protein [Lactococcus lactis]
MNNKQKVNLSNKEEFISIIGENTKKNYSFYKYMYGVLVPDKSSPLSCVSVANNSLSIDLWTGCALQCAYCHVQGIAEDINWSTKRMRTKPIRRNEFTIKNIVDELVKHPFFEKDKTIISIGTSSTEPFAQGEVLQSTIDIMNYFIECDFKNPFWIVTKAGVPSSAVEELKTIASKVKKLIISICYAGNKREIEPSRINRFRNIEKFTKEDNISFNWYLRPFNIEWFDSKEHFVESMFKEISEKYEDYIDSIIPGGLRWTEGIEYGICEARNLKLPKLIKENNIKTMESDMWRQFDQMKAKYFPNTQMYRHSSCGISFALNKGNICLAQLFNKHSCEASFCTDKQRSKCRSMIQKISDKQNLENLNSKLSNIGFEVKINSINIETGGITTTPELKELSPAVRTAFKHLIASEVS